MKPFLVFALALSLPTLPSLAQAANPPAEVLAKIAASQALVKLHEGVIADYGMQECEPFEVVRYSKELSKVSLRSLCTYVSDDHEEGGSGVLLKVRGWTDGDLPLILEKVEYIFAG